MFPGSFNLQGGTGISLNPKPVQTPTKTQLQPAVNPMSYNSVPISTGNYSNAQALAAHTNAPAPAAPAAPAPPPPDPYAHWGGIGNYNALTGQFDSNANTLRDSASNTASTNSGQYGIGIEGYLNDVTQKQNALNERGVQAELAKQQANQGILGMVGRGIQSGGVMLAGRNAGDSSAAEAIARAYGNIGQRQMNDVGNQYAQTERGIGIDQGDFNTNRAFGAKKLTNDEDVLNQQIISRAQASINDLNNWSATQSLPNRLNAAQEVAQIQARINGMINPQTDRLNSGIAAAAPAGVDANRIAASKLALAGTSATNPFDFQSGSPAQFNNTGVSPGSLPIYTTPRKKTA